MKYMLNPGFLPVLLFSWLLQISCSNSSSSDDPNNHDTGNTPSHMDSGEDADVNPDVGIDSDTYPYTDAGMSNDSEPDIKPDGGSDAEWAQDSDMDTKDDVDSGGDSGSFSDADTDAYSDTKSSIEEDIGTDCSPEGSFSITRMDSGYEIEVTDPPEQSCPIGALVCVLVIGEYCFSLHSYGTSGMTRVYHLTDEQYALLRDQDRVTGFYGYSDHGEKCTPPDISPFGGDPDCPIFGYLNKE